MASEAQQPQADNQSPYAPDGANDPLVFEAFEGINTATTRPGVDDKECAWLDGFMPLGPGRNLRTMPDRGPALAKFGLGGVSFFDFINIGATPYCIVIQSDGSISAVNTLTGKANTIAIPGTIVNPSRTNVGMAGYGNKYVIIVAKQANGYFIWNGTIFYKPNDPAPDGGLMPTAISGTAVEIYTGRVWIVNGATVTFSAPGSVHDFTTGSGGGNLTSSDSFLRVEFVELRQTNGFLYLIADSSVNYISGVATSGSPPVTTFTNQNLDPEIGTPWPGTVDVFNRNIIFANSFGAHIGYGGAISKVSEKLDGIFNSVPDFGAFVPSAAKAILYGKKIWIVLIPIVDPITGQVVNKMFCWNGKIWWATSQSTALQFIQHQEINSVISAWGTDGNDIFQLFQTPSDTFVKVAQTKLWDRPGGYEYYKDGVRLWGLFHFFSTINPNVSVSIDNENSGSAKVITITPLGVTWTNNVGVIATWTNNVGATADWFSSGNVVTAMAPDAIGQNGVLLGFTLTTSAADMAIISMKLAPLLVAYRG
jgi:hypothetical protein